MPLELKELKKLHDKAYNSGQVTRERASDDMVFYHITQWDDQILAGTQLGYRGEFNVLKKAGRQISADLASNPVQVDFQPKDETREDAAELADGMYRNDGNHNTSLEAFESAKQESVVCGVGAWELYTEYVSARSGDKKQVIKRRPLIEANNNIMWDPNAKLLDKSDADYCSRLDAYSEDGYKNLVKELTGEELLTISNDSFKHPEHSYAFPWIGGKGKKIYVVSFWHRVKIKEKVLTMEDPFGDTMELRESALEKVMDEMIDAGYTIDEDLTKKVERWQVTKYIASGAKILDATVIAGEHIPVVPTYGEHAYIEGEEHYEGVTRLAKDPSRLRNFGLSYVADIVSRSPRPKPIYYPEQIAGYERMYEGSGADNNFPYVLQNRKTMDGEDLTGIELRTTPEQTMPRALVAMLDLTRQAVEDVAQPGIPQQGRQGSPRIAEPNLSGKAVLALQARLDMQSLVYQEHYKHALRRDAEIWASMAPEVYDVPRKTMVELPDGTKQEKEIMQAVVDEETGDIVYLNDLRNAEFEIYSKIGPSYTSQREQTVEVLEKMLEGMMPDDPKRSILELKLMELSDGVDLDEIRDWARMELVLQGIRKPETDEEKAALEEAQNKEPEPDAAMVLAMAEDKKGQADLMESEQKTKQMLLDNDNEKANQAIKVFEAQTKRIEAETKARVAGVTIRKTSVETIGEQLDNEGKIIEMQSPKGVEDMSDEDLYRMLETG